MGVLKKVLVVFFAVLLVVNLSVANAAIAAERTVLNPGFVKSGLEEEEAYATAQTLLVEAAREQVSSSLPVDELPVSIGDIVRQAVTQEYLETQVETNVDRALSYLHGNRETLGVAVNLTPVKRRTAEAIGDTIRNLTVTEMIELAAEGAGTNLTVSAAGVTFDARDIGRMAEDRETYRAVREEFRADLREAAVDALVDQSFESASNATLIGLVGYDPTQYNESERATLVAENEGEIRDALRQQIEEEQGDQINRTVNDRLSQINELLDSQVEGLLGSGLGGASNASVIEPAANIVKTGIDGLTTDMTYATYRERINRSKANLAENASAFVRGALDEEVPDRIVLSEELDDATMEQIETARRAVIWFDRAAAALPLLALLLLGLVYLVSRSRRVVAVVAGVAALIAGALWFVVARRAPTLVRENAPVPSGERVEPAVEIAFGFLDQLVGALAAQSLGLAVAGVVLIALAVVDRTRGGDGGEPGAAADAAGADSESATARDAGETGE